MSAARDAAGAVGRAPASDAGLLGRRGAPGERRTARAPLILCRCAVSVPDDAPVAVRPPWDRPADRRDDRRIDEGCGNCVGPCRFGETSTTSGSSPVRRTKTSTRGERSAPLIARPACAEAGDHRLDGVWRSPGRRGGVRTRAGIRTRRASGPPPRAGAGRRPERKGGENRPTVSRDSTRIGSPRRVAPEGDLIGVGRRDPTGRAPVPGSLGVGRRAPCRCVDAIRRTLIANAFSEGNRRHRRSRRPRPRCTSAPVMASSTAATMSSSSESARLEVLCGSVRTDAGRGVDGWPGAAACGLA